MSTLLRLFNPETEETIELFVSEAEAQRAETDLEFATQLVVLSQSQASNPASPTSPSSSSSNSSRTIRADDNTPSTVGEASAMNGFKWPHQAILLLIEEYRKEQSNLVSGRVSQKKVWERIAQVLQDQGYIATGPQCLSKFNGMKRTYKSIKDHNGKSGNNLRSWPYMDVMESLLGEKPFMQPVATLSSTGTDHVTLTVPTAVDGITSPNCTRKRKATSEIAEAILESRRLAEESRERRHRERMEQKREYQEKMTQLMGELINKI